MDRHQRCSLAISSLALIVAFVSASMTAYFNYRGSRINVANIRPILAPRLEELSFDGTRVKIAMVVENRGKSTAVVEYLRLTAHQDSAKAIWSTGMQGALLYPGDSRREVFFLSRPHSVDGFVFDPKESIAAQGKLPVMLSYHSREVADDSFQESSEFSRLPWHDKSIIGVGE